MGAEEVSIQRAARSRPMQKATASEWAPEQKLGFGRLWTAILENSDRGPGEMVDRIRYLEGRGRPVPNFYGT